MENLNQYFSSVGREEIPSSVNIPESRLDYEFSFGEVKQLLKKINTSKATHSEDYPSWISKQCCEDLCIPVTNIINAMLKNGQYPKLWKSAEIRPLKKVPHLKTYKDYRPISLLSHIGKIAETAFLKIYKAHVIPKLSAH